MNTKSKYITIALAILLVIKIILYATIIPLIIFGLCLIGLLKKTMWSAILIALVVLASSIFDLYSGSLYGIKGIAGALILDIPTLILAFLFYKNLKTSKKK